MEEKWDIWFKSFAWTNGEVDTDLQGVKYLLSCFNEDTNFGSAYSTIGFLTGVFARWGDVFDMERFTMLLEGLHLRGRTVLLVSLRNTCHKGVQDVLDGYATVDSSLACEIRNPRGALADLPHTPVTESYHLDLYWGLYFGSGNKEYLRRIVEKAAWLRAPPGQGTRRRKNLAIGHAAIWSASGLSSLPHVRADLVSIFEESDALRVCFDQAVAEYQRLNARKSFANNPVQWGEA